MGRKNTVSLTHQRFVNGKVSAWVNRILKDRKYTQQQLATVLGCHPDAVRRWVKGLNTPKIDRVCLICDKMGVKPPEILLRRLWDTCPEWMEARRNR